MHFGGDSLFIMKNVAEIAFIASAERRQALNSSICSHTAAGKPVKNAVLFIAESAVTCESDEFARELAKEWEIWWYHRYHRNPFDRRKTEDRFLAYAVWRMLDTLDSNHSMHLLDQTLANVYRGRAIFERETIDPENPIDAQELGRGVLAPEILLDDSNQLYSMDSPFRSGEKNARFNVLSEFNVCGKSDFGTSTLEILYGVAVSSIACPLKPLAWLYSHKWEEWYNKKKNGIELDGRTSSDRFFEYVLARIWGKIPMDHEEVEFENFLAAKYVAGSSLSDLVITLSDDDEERWSLP